LRISYCRYHPLRDGRSKLSNYLCRLAIVVNRQRYLTRTMETARATRRSSHVEASNWHELRGGSASEQMHRSNKCSVSPDVVYGLSHRVLNAKKSNPGSMIFLIFEFHAWFVSECERRISAIVRKVNKLNTDSPQCTVDVIQLTTSSWIIHSSDHYSI